MDWPRVKTILIAFLTVINMILAGVLTARELQTAADRRHERQRLIEVLAEGGLIVDDLEIPEQRAYVYDLYRDVEAERACVEYLLGECEQAVSGGTQTYTGEFGSARFRANGFFEIAPELPIVLGAEDIQGSVLSLGQRMGFETDGDNVQVTESSVILYPQVQNLPVWAAYAEFSIDGGRVTGISGRWLLGKPLLSSNILCQPASTALLLLSRSEYASGVLQSVALGFQAAPISPNAVRLTPVWRLDFSSSSYYVDAVKNQISPA